MLNGTAKVEKDERLKPLLCHRCDSKNLLDSTFCTKCGVPLDLETPIELDQARAKLDKLFNKFAEDPQKLDKLLDLRAWIFIVLISCGLSGRT